MTWKRWNSNESNRKGASQQQALSNLRFQESNPAKNHGTHSDRISQ